MEGKLTVFKRPDSTYWQARFSYKRTYQSCSTKETDLNKAKKFATNWYHAKYTELRSGKQPVAKTKTFEYVADLALKEARTTSRSKSYLDALEEVLYAKGNLMEFLRHEDITKINNTQWQAYKRSLISQGRNLKLSTRKQHKNALDNAKATASQLRLLSFRFSEY
jgi:hypothetical protein